MGYLVCGLCQKKHKKERGIRIKSKTFSDDIKFEILWDLPIVFPKYVCILLTSLYADYIIVSNVNRIVLSPCPWIIRKLERL